MATKNQRTIKLDGEQFSLRDGVVYKFERLDDTEHAEWGWVKTKYRIGARAVLYSTEKLGKHNKRYALAFDCPDGIAGNGNPRVCRLHGWRGTTNDVSIDAFGEREITAIETLKNGDVSVTVGPDLRPDEA